MSEERQEPIKTNQFPVEAALKILKCKIHYTMQLHLFTFMTSAKKTLYFFHFTPSAYYNNYHNEHKQRYGMDKCVCVCVCSVAVCWVQTGR